MKREIKLSKEAARALRKQLKAFRKKFGRDPNPDEPIFFDPSKDVPTHMSPEGEAAIEAAVLAYLQSLNLGPEYIYAYRKTGLSGVPGRMDLWPEESVREWEAAVAEYLAIELKAKDDPSS